MLEERRGKPKCEERQLRSLEPVNQLARLGPWVIVRGRDGTNEFSEWQKSHDESRRSASLKQ